MNTSLDFLKQLDGDKSKRYMSVPEMCIRDRPDSYPYADNMTLEDLIIQAGGLREAASVVRVDAVSYTHLMTPL